MQWLNTIVDRLIELHGDEEIVVSSGVSPSGTYHLGTLREVMTAEVIVVELLRRGKQARHIHIVDDLDVFRKVPVNVPSEWQQYLGMPLCDVPAPDGSERSYADYFLADLIDAGDKMNLVMEVVRAHERYRGGAYTGVIETALSHIDTVRQVLAEVSGRELDESWSPIQVLEQGRIKNRQFVSMNTESKELRYINATGAEATVRYDDGSVKLNWRIDWPARWSLFGVDAEPFGRDHATKGGSYDTGVEIARQVFGIEPPLPVPYHFINRVGETKKMSKSAGNAITAAELLTILPPEIVKFFLFKSSPDKQLFFGEGETLLRLFDEFALLLETPDKEPWERQLVELCLDRVNERTVSNVPFSHLVASYQAALRNVDDTLAIIKRTEYADVAEAQADIIRRELALIDTWLDTWAPDELKFSLIERVEAKQFSDEEKRYFAQLADKIRAAPADADGAWFHNAIYDFKDTAGLAPKDLFTSLYRLIIGQQSGPRAGWFLSILPRDWLINRLMLVEHY